MIMKHDILLYKDKPCFQILLKDLVSLNILEYPRYSNSLD